MEQHRNLIVLTCVAIYMVLCIGVGIWAMRRTKSTEDFFMAGRNLGVMVTGLAVFSSTLSGFGFVGGPGLIYKMGTSSMWMIVCSGIGFCLSFFLLGKRLRMFAELKDSLSLPDVVAARYNSEVSRFLTGLVIFLGVITYLGAQIMAMTVVLQDIFRNVEWIGETSKITCMSISVAVLVFYCVTGGILASVYTDLVQGTIMIIAALLVFFSALSAVDGGIAGVVTTVMADDPESMSPWGSLGIMGCLSWFLIFGIGGMGQPHIITKMMMTKNVGDARNILPVSVIGYSVSALLWISIGFVMRALVLQTAHPELGGPDDAASQFLQNYANPLLSGVVFAGLFAAIMSTADGFLNIGASAVVHDMPKAILGRRLSNELLLARIATLVIAVFAAVFALNAPDQLVALLGTFGWSVFAAAIVPVVAIGFNWKRATALAANVAMVSSMFTIFFVEFIYIKALGNGVPYGINTGAIAIIVSMFLFFTISLLSPPPKLDPEIEKVMDL